MECVLKDQHPELSVVPDESHGDCAPLLQLPGCVIVHPSDVVPVMTGIVLTPDMLKYISSIWCVDL